MIKEKILKVLLFVVAVVVGQKVPILFLSHLIHGEQMIRWSDRLLWIVNLGSLQYSLVVAFATLIICIYFVLKTGGKLILLEGCLLGCYFFIILYPLSKHEVLGELVLSENSSQLLEYFFYGMLFIVIPIVVSFVVYKMSNWLKFRAKSETDLSNNRQ